MSNSTLFLFYNPLPIMQLSASHAFLSVIRFSYEFCWFLSESFPGLCLLLITCSRNLSKSLLFLLFYGLHDACLLFHLDRHLDSSLDKDLMSCLCCRQLLGRYNHYAWGELVLSVWGLFLFQLLLVRLEDLNLWILFLRFHRINDSCLFQIILYHLVGFISLWNCIKCYKLIFQNEFIFRILFSNFLMLILFYLVFNGLFNLLFFLDKHFPQFLFLIKFLFIKNLFALPQL